MPSSPEYMKKWEEENKERRKEYHKKYREENKVKRYAYNKEYLKTYFRSPKGIYNNQKSSAIHRGIEWLFTFETWWKVWEECGKWDSRGITSGKYCMCRHGDVGPYSAENVYIATQTQNLKDGVKFRKAKVQ